MRVEITSKGGVFVTVYDGRLDSMAVGYTNRKGNTIQSFARAYAPVRSGRLRSSIRIRKSLAGGFKVIRVRASTPYAAAVHEGSGPTIYPRNGAYLRVPVRRGSTKKMDRVSVRGIMGPSITPFLSMALDSSMRSPLSGVRLRSLS